MEVSLGLEPGAAADDVPERNEQLHQQCVRVCLGVRLEDVEHLPDAIACGRASGRIAAGHTGLDGDCEGDADAADYRRPTPRAQSCRLHPRRRGREKTSIGRSRWSTET